MQNPKIILCGVNPRLKMFLDLYHLHPAMPIAVVDYAAEIEDTEIKNFPVRKLEEFDAASIEKIIFFATPAIAPYSNSRNFPEAINYFKSHGIEQDKLLFVNQPGQIFRAILPYLDTSKVYVHDSAKLAIYYNLFERPAYAFAIMLAAEQARRMGKTCVTLIEAGVWHGEGLLNICEFADFLSQTQGMNFKVIGLDTGEGLSEVKDWRDHPELWHTGSMEMHDLNKLRQTLPSYAEVIVGDVKDTVPQLIADQKITADAPLGFLAVDVDLYSATVNLLKILEIDADCLLPATVLWVDDSFANVLQNRFAGEALAIAEFNNAHALRKIDHKIVRSTRQPEYWHHCFHFCHVFDHPVRQGTQKADFNLFFDFLY